MDDIEEKEVDNNIRDTVSSMGMLTKEGYPYYPNYLLQTLEKEVAKLKNLLFRFAIFSSFKF